MLKRRSLIAIFLLLSILAPLLLPHLMLKHQKTLIRKEVKKQIIAGLDHDELVELHFPVTQTNKLLKWKHSHEFEYRGLMFDIVEQEIIGDTVTYLCWPDRQETELNHRHDMLAAQAFNQDPFSNSIKLKTVAFFLSLFSGQEMANILDLPETEIFFPPIKQISGIDFAPSAPPPEFLS
jgi:hypothetical protein